jgi:hypothetical protein
MAAARAHEDPSLGNMAERSRVVWARGRSRMATWTTVGLFLILILIFLVLLNNINNINNYNIYFYIA